MQKRTNFRWVICGMLFAATLINYLDRDVLGILKPKLAEIYGWNDKDYALILNFFQAAYALGQVLFGPILAWLGTKSAFAISIVIWSLAAMGTAFAGFMPGVALPFLGKLSGSVAGFSLARFVLGVGEGGNFPACIRTVAEWFPQKERSIATGWFNTGSSLGKVITPLVVPFLFIRFGWQASFIILGAIGFIWLVVWLLVFSTPEESKMINPEELALIQSEVPDAVGDKPVDREEKVSWFKMMSYRQTWAYVFTGIMVGPAWWFYGFWLPDLFNKMFKLDIKSFGWPLAFIALGSVLGSIGGGMLSPYLMRRGMTLNAARKISALICALGVVPVLLIPSIAGAGVVNGDAAKWAVWLSALIFAFANAAHQGWSATMYTVVSDLFPKNGVASVVGFGGAVAAGASIVFQWYVGDWLTRTGSYDRLLYMIGGAYVVAIVVFHLVVPRIRRVKIE